MKKYTYSDWYSGKVRLDSCSAIFPKGMQPISAVSLNEFNRSDIAKIQKKQKEIFETEKDFYLKRFLDEFISRSRNSKQKVAYLKSEQFKYRSILTGNDDIDLDKHYEIVGVNLFYYGRDLYTYREYFKNVVINGQERDYSFINSPNYLYQSGDIQPREIFAQAMIEYLDFLTEFISNQTKKVDQKKREKESYEKIFNSSFDFCKSFEDFLQVLQINELTLKPNELLIKLNEYKTYYSKALEHYLKFDKEAIQSTIYQNILNRIIEKLDSLLRTEPEHILKDGIDSIKNPSLVASNNNKKSNVSNIPIVLDMFFADQEKFKSIMNLLVKKGFCHAVTYIWEDHENSNKATVVSLLKYLHVLGFYKDNRKLTAKETIEVAKNTFGVTLSESLLKKHKMCNNEINFIPASNLIIL